MTTMMKRLNHKSLIMNSSLQTSKKYSKKIKERKKSLARPRLEWAKTFVVVIMNNIPGN